MRLLSRHCDFLRTNKSMKALVEPYLFEEVNLTYSLNTEYGDCVQRHVIKPQGQHIRVIRAYLDSGSPAISLDNIGGEPEPYRHLVQASLLAEILAACPNVHSLGLYYHHWDIDFTPVTEKILPLIENGTLTALGIYSVPIMLSPLTWSVFYVNGGTSGPIQLLNEITASGISNLKAFDFVAEWMPRETYAALQASPTFAHLTSLSVRYAFRHVLLWVNDTAKRLSAWAPRTRLTRLQLINCQTVYAPDIPVIVGIFDALEELIVSTCGHGDDVIPSRRSTGWSTYPDALWKRKAALREFGIEHMSQWEILALGVIPALTVICANVRPDSMLRALEEDGELFPGMKVLRVLPRKGLEIEMTKMEVWIRNITDLKIRMKGGWI
ncbi:hypothetical protein M408DRAFT_101443 [Serendipita vermifera MAFF 305830]|uniref:F-box domain-containing protein n=1 Tax=Serendipita vermifera MAFF 305830 TaxID=933852 RepID=A0A0C3BFC4_SERVB|nr:hypothetical protein M408DRAFT_101443 [Serendipita vermifera MAFF 305830]